MLHVRFGLVLALLLVGVGCSSTQSLNSTEQPASKAVELDSSEIFEIFSSTNKQNYRIRARLPASYSTDTDKQYPIIIKVDGQWDFLLATSAYNCIYFDGQMPEAVIVGIDWGDVEGNIHEIRARDLLPQASRHFANSGHAASFVKVIAEEIVPALEKRYRLNGERYLLGGSWGGLFVTYALLEKPEVFAGAIAIGPSYGAAVDVLQKQIEAASKSKQFDGKRLYVGIGKWDSIESDVLSYAKALTDAKVPGLNFKLDHLEGFGHSGMNIPGYAAGYQYIFSRPRLSLSPHQLQPLVGVYRMEGDEDEIEVAISGPDLTVKLSDGHVNLWAKSETSFYHPGVFYNLSFTEGQALLETFFGQYRYIRVTPQ